MTKQTNKKKKPDDSFQEITTRAKKGNPPWYRFMRGGERAKDVGRDDRIELYRDRYDLGYDIYSGVPSKEAVLDKERIERVTTNPSLGRR
jgi:hypothetical protein